MNFPEKRLYHQIHPIKLSIDIGTAIFTLYLFWLHYFLMALILHIFLPVIGSFLVISFFDLKKQKQSKFGRYIRKYMTGSVETIRLLGDIVTVFGAWYHNWIIIFLGIIIILAAWLNGKIQRIL